MLPFVHSSKGSPVAKQIAPDQDFNPSTAISLKGRIFDRNCKPISDARVDVWYAGGNPGNCIIFKINVGSREFKVLNSNFDIFISWLHISSRNPLVPWTKFYRFGRIYLYTTIFYFKITSIIYI